MPIYTVDNPSCSLESAKEKLAGVLGENLVAVTSITAKNASRISVETKSQIDSSKIAIALGRTPKQAAAEKVEPADKSESPNVESAPTISPL